MEPRYNPTTQAFGTDEASNGGGKPREVVRRAKAAMTTLAAQAEEQMKTNPRRVLGIACAVGVAVGVVLSSRILRFVIASAASYAAVDLTRAFLRENLPQLKLTGSAT